MHGAVADDAVAFADGVVEAGELFAASGGFDPETELADLDGLGIQVDAVEIVLENLAVEIEKGALAAKFFEAGIGNFVKGVKLIEGFDEKSAATAGGVQDTEAF
jgi:hypothetical protein